MQELEPDKTIYGFLKDNLKAFKMLKESTLIIEELTGEYVIAPINEQRAILFHLFKMVEDDSEELVQENFFAAKEHLYRALYDTLSILQSILIKDLKKNSEKYKIGTLSLIYPQFFQQVEPKITIIQGKISSLRASRPAHYPNNDIDLIWAGVLFLISENDKFKGMIPAFEQYELEQKEKQNKENKFRILLVIGSVALTALIGLGIKYFLKL